MKKVALLTVGLSILTACTLATQQRNGKALTGSCAGMTQFDFICGAEKPEDLAHIPGTPWIIASGFAKGAGLKIIHNQRGIARAWFTGRSDQSNHHPIASDCAAAPDPALFTARGLNLRVVAPGKARLLVVNHGGREAIEIFEVDFSKADATPSLRWQGCVLMPPGQVGNSVASYSDGTILVTVLTRAGTTITDFVSGRATGDVWERKAGERALRLLPGTQLPGNNGIETARDDSGFYVVAFGPREIVAYARSDTRQPLWRAQAPDFMPDNIHWDGDRLLLAVWFAMNPPAEAFARSSLAWLTPWHVIAVIWWRNWIQRRSDFPLLRKASAIPFSMVFPPRSSWMAMCGLVRISRIASLSIAGRLPETISRKLLRTSSYILLASPGKSA